MNPIIPYRSYYPRTARAKKLAFIYREWDKVLSKAATRLAAKRWYRKHEYFTLTLHQFDTSRSLGLNVQIFSQDLQTCASTPLTTILAPGWMHEPIGFWEGQSTATLFDSVEDSADEGPP